MNRSGSYLCGVVNLKGMHKPSPPRNLKEELAYQEEQRDLFSRQVIDSTSQKKVIVSGPGTGKTFLFTQIIERHKGDCLAITFINNLADKLKRNLPANAISCTFHSYCRQLLYKYSIEGIGRQFNYFPIKLEEIIGSDAQISGYSYDFKHCFKRLEHENPALQFFIKKGDYYNAVSFDDSVYRMLKYFQENQSDIPEYDCIVVDEYQDFNPLEVAFIDVLCSKSNILLVGDDDQALYSRKDASSHFIRNKYRNDEYEPFQLPYCSRCPQVIISAVNDIIQSANRIGKLKDRINKEYICYLPDKLDDNNKNPRIFLVTCSVQSNKSPYMARFIEQVASCLTQDEITKANEKGDYTILVTGPSQYLRQIYAVLRSHQDWRLSYQPSDEDKERSHLTLLDGYKILLSTDPFSNLGWRILLEISRLEGKSDLLKRAFEQEQRLFDCLPKGFIKKHERILDLLQNVKAGNLLSKEDVELIKSVFRVEPTDLQQDLVRSSYKDEEVSTEIEDEQTKLKIKLASYVGCKGLAAGYVFIVGLNEGNLPRTNQGPTDFEICEMIVALTRTIKRCYLMSVKNFSGKFTKEISQFVTWIKNSRITPVEVNKYYWHKP